jgi:hypothetical protein
MPREGEGAVVAVKEQEDDWRLGMLVAVTNDSLHFFEWTGVPFWNTHYQVNVTVAIANWEGIGRKASARDNRKGLK